MKSDYIKQAVSNITANAAARGHTIDHNKVATHFDMEFLHNSQRHLHSSHHSIPIAIDFLCIITNKVDLVTLADIIVINAVISKSFHLLVYCLLLLVGKMSLLRMCLSFNTFDTSFLDSLMII